MPSAYEILGVPRDVAPDELRRAYRELVRVWHPDRFQGEPRLQAQATERLKEISAAYQAILGDRRTDTPEPDASGPAAAGHRARRRGPSPWVRAWMAEVSRRLPWDWSRWALGCGIALMAIAGLLELHQRTAPPRLVAPESAARPPQRRLPDSATELVAELNRGLSAPVALSGAADGRPGASGPPAAGPALSGFEERPANGAELAPARHGAGRGELTITNDGPYDAEVKLVTAGAARELCRHIFIRARSQHTLRGVPPGSYDLLFRAGEDWKAASRAFARVRAVARMGRPLRWDEAETATEVRYQKRQVSLQVTPPTGSGLVPLPDDEFARTP